MIKVLAPSLNYWSFFYYFVPPSFFVIAWSLWFAFNPYLVTFVAIPYAQRIISPQPPVYGFSSTEGIIYAVSQNKIYKISTNLVRVEEIKIKNVKMERIKLQNNKVYVSSNKFADILVFKTFPFSLLKIVSPKPKPGGSITIDGNLKNEIYTVPDLGKNLEIIDDKTLEKKREFSLPCFLPSPYDIEYYRRENKIFLTNWMTCPYIIEIDLKQKKHKSHFVGFSQCALKIKNNLLFVIRPIVGSVDIYFLPNMKKKKRIWIEEGIRTIDIIDNKHIAVGNFFNGKIYLIDITKGKIVKTIPLCGGIREVGYEPLNSKLYASSSCGLWGIDMTAILYKKTKKI